jgi:predicted MFS family arabinose efflux permease
LDAATGENGRDMDAYKRVLARPGIRSLMITMMLARIPVTATAIMLTLHVILGKAQGGLGLSYAAAGAVAALIAIGNGVGAPLVGRAIDRVGLVPVIVVTTVAQTAFWATARLYSYAWLLPGALGAGLLALPVFIVARQSLAARLPDEERQAGFALDSMSVELSFAVGPAAGAAAITQAGSTIALTALAATFAAAGLAIIVLNPPMTGSQSARTPVRLRSWVDGRVVAVLIVTVGATITLAGTDVAITAMMRHFGRIGLVGVVISVWCLGSLAGGFVYGMMRRRVRPLVLLLLLAGFTLPVGLATTWWWLALLLIPSTIFCAPLISATVDGLIGIAPSSERGVAMGLHSSALTFGVAMGAPLAGITIDASSPPYGFVGVGVAGLVLAACAPLALRSRRSKDPAGADDGNRTRTVSLGS